MTQLNSPPYNVPIDTWKALMGVSDEFIMLITLVVALGHAHGMMSLMFTLVSLYCLERELLIENM